MPHTAAYSFELRTANSPRWGALAAAALLGVALSACGPAPQSKAPDTPAGGTKAPATAPAAELPPMPGARPAESLPTVDAKQLESAVAQEMEKQAREIRAGVREAEQARPILPPLDDAIAPAAPASDASPALASSPASVPSGAADKR